MNDRELLTAIARDVMGWTVTEKPVEANDTGETLFFLDEAKPIKATSYKYSANLRAHGACNHGYNWIKWNPLTDANARDDVMNAIVANGCRVILDIGHDSTYCAIDASTGVKISDANELTPGLALCKAALHWAEQNEIEDEATLKMLGDLSAFMTGRWPDKATFAAIDANGNVFAYPAKPIVNPIGKQWIATQLGVVVQSGWLAIDPQAQWNKLIIERPPASDGPGAEEIFALNDIVI